MKSIYTLYQPIVEIDSSKIIGYEALTRGQGKYKVPIELFRRAYQSGRVITFDLQSLLSQRLTVDFS